MHAPRQRDGATGPGNLLLSGGRVVLPGGERTCDVRIARGQIAELGQGLAPAPGEQHIDAQGHLLLPAQIDPQVHFREPGNEHKEDIESGSTAAALGGASGFLEMPNTKPPTTDRGALEDKLARARGRAAIDYAFFVGATADNVGALAELEGMPGCAGVKVFMGSSTGNLLVGDDETLERILRSTTRRVTVHSEDERTLQANYRSLPAGSPTSAHPDVRSVEAAVRSTTRLLDLVEKTGRAAHLLHVSTAEEIDLVRARDLGDLLTVEVTPNHLFLAAPECYEQQGSWAQMNPPVREVRHRDRLRQALTDGTVACIGSDHAPHTAKEKDRPYPQAPSGIPGVQTTLALLLTAVRDGWLSLGDLPRLTNAGPRAVYGIGSKGWLEPGSDGDVVVIDPARREPLDGAWLASRSRTNPFVGRELSGLPVLTVLRGEVIARDGQLVQRGRGRPLEFGAR